MKLRACLILAAVAFQSFMVPQMSVAQGMQLEYDVWAGGFRALGAELTLDTGGEGVAAGTYDAALALQTTGMTGAVFPWTGHFQAAGRMMPDGRTEPQRFDYLSNWLGHPRIRALIWGDDGFGNSAPLRREKDGDAPLREDYLPEKLDIAARDLMSTATMLLQTGQCEGAHLVTDGKRSYRLILSPDGTETLTANRYNAFGGDTLRCAVRVEMRGGTWRSTHRAWLAPEQDNASAPITLWLGRPAGFDGLVPVKMAFRAPVGTVFAHYRGGARVPAQAEVRINADGL